jgi:hypothetical protein
MRRHGDPWRWKLLQALSDIVQSSNKDIDGMVGEAQMKVGYIQTRHWIYPMGPGNAAMVLVLAFFTAALASCLAMLASIIHFRRGEEGQGEAVNL